MCLCVEKERGQDIEGKRWRPESGSFVLFALLPFFGFLLVVFLFVISLKANDSLKGFFFRGGCGFGSVKGKSCPPRRDLRPCVRG